MTERVVITGLGTINPLGHSASSSWKNAIHGISGVGPVTRFPIDEQYINIVSEVKGFRPEDYLPVKEARRQDLFTQFAMISTQEALAQSGLDLERVDRSRVGIFLASGIGGLNTLIDVILTEKLEGPRRINPFGVPMLMPNSAAGAISIRYDLGGPAIAVATACASGADGIGLAWQLIRSGVIDLAIAGGSEAPITTVGLGAFGRMGALSKRDWDYATPRPFDSERDGFVLGEGAAVLLLENERHATRRGAGILAELAGYGSTSDAYHITAPAEGGAGGVAAMQVALAAARLNPDEVSYINAHGTGTLLNDVAETAAIKTVFGDLAYNIPVSSTKSMTGHLVGATGAVEAVFAVKAIQENLIPPTINLQDPDPECDLDYVPMEARELPVQTVLSNAFGFGGHNAVLVIRAYY